MCRERQTIFFLNDFLKKINYDKIYQLEDSQTYSLRFKLITGKKLLKLKVEEEALRLNIPDKELINSAVDNLWNQPSIREHYIFHVDKINTKIFDRVQENSKHINRIIQLDEKQLVNNNLEDNLFNGVIFDTKNHKGFGTSFS
ncbi:hypothetical protein C1645_731943 [Glomus cerebriforme]|uniref:Uncharacterized protein n=1 Tax=Glomus cerebriforme TaxID=658196 RepID=A0A397TJ62_9GLOM|nr:hypothetical protein C1645_731943 [Glomus cerebriforme]